MAEFKFTERMRCGAPMDGFCPASSVGKLIVVGRVIVFRIQLRPFSSSFISFQTNKKPPTYDRTNTKSNWVTGDLFPSRRLRAGCRRLPTFRRNRMKIAPRNCMQTPILAAAAAKQSSLGRCVRWQQCSRKFFAQTGESDFCFQRDSQ